MNPSRPAPLVALRSRHLNSCGLCAHRWSSGPGGLRSGRAGFSQHERSVDRGPHPPMSDGGNEGGGGEGDPLFFRPRFPTESERERGLGGAPPNPPESSNTARTLRWEPKIQRECEKVAQTVAFRQGRAHKKSSVSHAEIEAPLPGPVFGPAGFLRRVLIRWRSELSPDIRRFRCSQGILI